MTAGKSALVPVCAATLAMVLATGLGGCASSDRGGRRSAPKARIAGGWMEFGSSEAAAVPGRPFVGLQYCFKRGRRTAWELGVQAAPDINAPAERVLVTGQCSVMWFPGRRKNLYLHAGGGGAWETTTTSSYAAGLASLGAGYGLSGRVSLDIRVGYLRIFQTGNHQDAFQLTLARRF